MYLDEAVQRVKDAYSKAFCKGENEMHEIILIDEYSGESIETTFEVVKAAEFALNCKLERLRRDARLMPYISRYDVSTALGFKQIPSCYEGIKIYKDKCIRFKNGMRVRVSVDEFPKVELRLYDCVCDCSWSAAEFVMRYCEHDNEALKALKDLHEICNKDGKELAELAKNIIKGENEMYKVVDGKVYLDVPDYLNAYSKALAKFYEKEREDMNLYYDCSDMTGFIGGHVFRDRVNQVDLAIKKVIFNDPATIILWKDGSKTVVKCGDHEKYDPEKGFAMALAKRYLGNRGRYYELFKRHLPEKTFTSDNDEVLVRAKLVGPLSPKKGNTKYIIKLPGHAAAVSLDQEYLVEVEE